MTHVSDPAPSIATAELDLLYIVRPGDDNEELRYSLRSIAANLPHRKVWIVGHCPAWVRGVEVIELDPLEEKFANQRQSLTAAVNHPDLSDPFVLMNDDMFVLRRLDELPVVHLGALAVHVASLQPQMPLSQTSWGAGIVATAALMDEWGYPDADMYEAHTPLPFRKKALADLLTKAEPVGGPFLWGCAYDACGAIKGTQGKNAKIGSVRRRAVGEHLRSGYPFLSSNDHSFADGPVGEFARNRWPHPCTYEEAS